MEQNLDRATAMSEPYNACYAPPSGARAQRGRAPQRSEERRSSAAEPPI